MVVGGRQGDVAQSGHLEAVAVTLVLGLLVATVILDGELRTAVSEVVALDAHQLVRLSAQVLTDVARGAVVLLEELADLVERLAGHLHRVDRRSGSLIGQRGGTSVPELHEVVVGVEDRRGVHAAQLSANTLREGLVVDTSRVQTVARGARNGVVGRQTGIVVELVAQHHLADVHRNRVLNRADRLVRPLLVGQRVGVEGLTLRLGPCERHLRLLVRERRTPVYQVVLGQRHRTVGNHLLDLRQVHFVDLLSVLQRLHHRSHVERTVAQPHILLHQLARYREVGIERQLRIGRVAGDTSAARHDLLHLRIAFEVGRRCLVHQSVDDAKHDYHYQHG